MTDETDPLDTFLDEIYLGQDRMTRDEIQRSAVAAALPADLLTRIDRLPEGQYAQDEVTEILHGQAV